MASHFPARYTAITLAGVLPLGGCSNPLWPAGDERGREVPIQRLREIDTLRLDRFERPAPPEGAPEPDPTAETRRLFEAMERVPLSIAEARAAALRYNLDLKVSLVNPAIGEARVEEEEAKFESAFTTRALWQETDSPTASELASAQQKFQFVEPGVRIPLRTGGTATVSLPMSRNETNNQFSTLNPSYESDLEFSISHPLLRNAGIDVNTASIQIAGYNRQIIEAQTKLAIINQLSAVERTYWVLYEARRDLEVRQREYELAQAQLERAGRIVDSGMQAEIEVVRAQAGVAERLGAILVAQTRVLAEQRELKRVINVPGLDVGSTSVVLPTTDPTPVEYLVDSNALANAAVQNRMELLELELQLLADATAIRFDRNQTLPRLDLDATYRFNGLGRSGQDAFHMLGRHRFEDWSVGATLEVPLGNEAARSRLRQSLLTRLQRLTTRESRQLLVRQEVLGAIDRIDSGWQRILAARQATILSARTLQAEQRQFDLGASTSTDVLDALTRLGLAQLAEIRAVVDYQLAQVDLAAATGTLPGATGVRWSPADDLAGERPEAPPIIPVDEAALTPAN